MDLDYVFERMYSGHHMYQVRLNGEFVCYSNEKNPEDIDKQLKENGFDSREDFLEYCAEENKKFLEGLK
jgi:hypothetical protein